VSSEILAGSSVASPGRRLDLDPRRRRVEPDGGEVPEVGGDLLVRVRRDRRGGRDGDQRNVGFDDASGVPADRRIEVHVEPLRGDPVRMEPDVVGAPAVLLHPDRADRLALEFPPEQPDLAAGEEAFGGLDVLDGGLDGEDGRESKVGEEAEERLRAERLVDALHAEVLQRGQAVDDEPGVLAAGDLHLEGLLEGRERHLHARELGRLADRRGHIGKPYRMADRRDVLERRPLVPHHVRDGVEHPHLVEIGGEAPVVLPDLVRRLLEGDEKRVLPASDPFAEELEGELRLARPRRADDQVRPVREQATHEDGVDLRIARREPVLRRRRRRSRGRRIRHPLGSPVPVRTVARERGMVDPTR